MRNFSLPGRSPAYARHGMVATSSPLASLAALDCLRTGGTAADAAVTAAAVLCIAEPHMMGIGGDCFVLVGEPSGKAAGLNGAGRAALAADSAWLKASGLRAIPPRSVHAITVPGAVDAWARLLERYGRRSLAETLKPAIGLAQEGVPTTPRVAHDWLEEAAILAADAGGCRHYLKAGRAPRAGEMMAYPALARSLEIIAREGPDGFYRGSLTRDILNTLQPMGSLLTGDDFAHHRSDWVEPIATPFMGREVLELPPNGQGLTALLALGILAAHGITRYDPLSADRLHLEIEAMKLAWVIRNRVIADPDVMEVSPEDLLAPAEIQRLANLIDMNRALDADVALSASDTVYLTVVDESRLAVSFINSIYWGFGSGIVTPETGIALQNRGACFVTDPAHPNCIGPGKRPLHTIIPALVRDKSLIDMSYGVMGGDYQPMGHVTVAVNRYAYGMDPQEALDFPTLFPQGPRGLAGTGCTARRGRRTQPPRPLRGGGAGALGRRPGHRHRPPQRCADRRFRPAQGRFGTRLLN